MAHTVDIVVADMARALAFYRLLGLAVPDAAADAMQVQVPADGGAAIGFLTEAAMRSQGEWIEPVGQRVTLAFRCDTATELDATFAKVVAAGHVGAKAPWDAFWGQRYASLRDPDGNRVDLFAPLAAA